MLDDLHDLDALMRSQRWLAEHTVWSQQASEHRRFDPERRAAFAVYFDELRERTLRLQERVKSIATLDLERTSNRETLLGHTVSVERVLAAFRGMCAERQSPEVGEPLQLADACAWEIYATFMLNRANRGATTADLAPPVVTLGAVETPLMFPRNGARAEDGSAWDLRHVPIPIVVLPTPDVAALWSWTALAHEIGHVIDQKLDLSFTREGELHKALSRAALSHRGEWVGWLREIVADALGLLLGGDGYAWTLAILFDRRRMWEQRPSDDHHHPPPTVRMRLLSAWLAARKADEGLQERLRDLVKDRSGDGAVAAAYEEDIAEVASLVLGEPLSKLGNRSLGEVAPAAEADRAATRDIVAYLTGKKEEIPQAAWRLVPGAAQLAVVDDRVGLDEARVSNVNARAMIALTWLTGQARPEWLTPPRDFAFLRSEVPAHRATLLDETTGRKVPPHVLMVRHRRLAFVGSTNDQLEKGLKQAFADRGRKRWTSVEVFFLRDPALGWMRVSDRGPGFDGDLAEARKRAIEALTDCLPDLADKWALLDYDAPFYFASYWDAEEPGGRIHVSPAIWEKDIRDCPADDYVRGDDVPSRKYQDYLGGLRGLRRVARSFAGNMGASHPA